MILSISLYRWDLTPYEEERFCDSYDFTVDEIDATVKSEFELDREVEVFTGDWLRAKDSISGKVWYFGFVDSSEKKKVRCRGLLGLADSTIVTRQTSGSSFELHSLNLVRKYLLQDSTKNLPCLDVQIESNTSHAYQATDISVKKLNSYLINGFKKYNVKWYFKALSKEKILTAFKTNVKTIRFTDTTSEIFGWDVFVKRSNSGNENEILIVDKNVSDMENPIILATYYLAENGITQNPNDTTITRPTVTTTYLYDTTATDKPSYESVANSELKGNAYSHEISFYIRFDSQNFDIDEIETGLYADIYYHGINYKSVITALSVSNDLEALKVTCGNVRSRLIDNFED